MTDLRICGNERLDRGKIQPLKQGQTAVPKIQTKVSLALAEDVSAPERRAFQRQRPQLMRRYAGQYVAIYGGRIAGHDKNDETLAARMFARFGDAPFYIGRVEDTPSVYEVPSPELAG